MSTVCMLVLVALWSVSAHAQPLPTDDAPAAGSAPTVIAEQAAEPGGVFRVVVSGSPLPARVSLLAPDDRVITTVERIDVRMTDDEALGVFLFGLDSTLAPGAYRIVGSDEAGDELFARPLTVGEKDFRSEEIALNQDLTSLRSDYDPRKIEETRVLSELVLSRDPLALYHPGLLAWPLPEDTRLTSYFGDRRTFLYSDGGRARSIHVGLDLAAPVGTPVHSSGVGVVRMARDRIVTGKTVVIEHLPGVYSLYYHLDELLVDEGVEVGEGETIGTVGATGLATGPHLHWEIRVSGVPVSPVAATQQPLLFGALAP